nr:hypothetical protein [Syntrophales bacterium]
QGSMQPPLPALPASPAPQAQPMQPPTQAQQAQSEPDPAASEVLDKEQSARQALQEKKAAMKKKKRDVMGLWD